MSVQFMWGSAPITLQSCAGNMTTVHSRGHTIQADTHSAILSKSDNGHPCAPPGSVNFIIYFFEGTTSILARVFVHTVVLIMITCTNLCLAKLTV